MEKFMQGRKHALLAFLILTICVTLSGCSFESGDGLASLPKLPGEYVTLQKKLDAVLAQGLTYAVAESGPNRQSVQLIDMNGDGIDEVIAFFKGTTSGEYTVCVFSKEGDDYIEIGRAKGYGKYLREVHYPITGGSGTRAIALSWGTEDSSAYNMSVHTIGDAGLIDALSIKYSNILISDLNKDGADEIVCTTFDRTARAMVLFEYGFEGEKCNLISEAPLSTDIKNVTKISKSLAADATSALYIDSLLTTGGYITDIVEYKGRTLTNKTIDQDSKKSNVTWRQVNVACKDIDGDGIMEVPQANMLPGYVDPSDADTRWKLKWTKFVGGQPAAATIDTFQSSTEDWYLNWPKQWGEDVTVVRKSESGITKAIFFAPPKNAKDGVPYLLPQDGNILLNVWVFSGDSRREYFNNSGMSVLKESESLIYAYSLPENDYPKLAITPAEVAENFKTITHEWGSEVFY